MALAAGTCSSTATWNIAPLRSALPSYPSLHVIAGHTVLRPSASLRLGLSTPNYKPSVLQATSLASHSSLFGSFLSGEVNPFANGFTVSKNRRFKVLAMRHGRHLPKLGRPADQRKALLRGLTTQLLKYGRIKTTKARASALRKYIDKMITLAKDGSLHKRRQALGFIYEKQIVHALFAEVQDRYGERNGGYTRVIRTLPRRGDNAPMAYIELV